MSKITYCLLSIAYLFISCNIDNAKTEKLEKDIVSLKAKIVELEGRITILESGQYSKKPSTGLSKKKPGIPLSASTNSSSSDPDPSKSKYSEKAISSGQCNAITKKGRRCSRNSRSGGYCWQHGG